MTQILSRISRFFGPVIILAIFTYLLFQSTTTRLTSVDRGLKVQLISVIQFFDNRFYDWRSTKLISPHHVDADQVIVAIDDESLSRIGKYPFPRRIYAQLLDRLAELGAKTVGFDILFPEHSNPEDDQLLLDGISRFRKDGREIILSYSIVDDKNDSPDDPPRFWYEQVLNGAPFNNTKLFFVNKFTDPFPELAESDVLLGHIGGDEDQDGVFRHYRLVANVDGNYLPSLALAMYQAHKNKKVEMIEIPGRGAGLKDGAHEIAVDDIGSLRIRYSAALENYPALPLWKVLKKHDKKTEAKFKSIFKNKAVMVGSMAEGAHDFRNSPIDPKMPGMFAHTNALTMLFHNRYFVDDFTNFLIGFSMLLVGYLILIFVMRQGSAKRDLVALVVIIAGINLIDRYFLLPKGYQIRLFFPMACTFFTYSWSTFINFQKALKEKRQIKGTFARYVSPAIVNEMLDNPEKLKVGGEKRDITCLFSDVRDFTSISEGLTPQELSGALNKYMGTMTDIVFETKGTLDKYIGDAIVAFWGAPLDLPNHPECAVDGAVKMMEALPAVNADFKARNLPEFKVGIGLNSGECSVGNMGSNKIFSYTALGDNMNLGARLEGLCKYYGANILISEYTYARLPKDKYKVRKLDKVIVKGKTTPVQILEVIHGVHPLFADEAAFKSYNLAYDAFLNQDFGQSKTYLEGILINHPEDKPTVRLIKLCEKWLDNPVPHDFDVTKMTEK